MNLLKGKIVVNSIERAKNVFDIEIETLIDIKNSLDNSFQKFVDIIYNSSGKVIITGMGKSGHIGQKIAATMASLGTPSFFVHPGEAAHGDLGMIEKKDIVLMISNSGETQEVLQLLPSIRKIGAKILSITSNENSTLAKNSDYTAVIKVKKEACIMNIAPTSSTTAVLVYGDALAICLSEMKNFDKNKFGIFHPKGTIGKRLLLKVSDLMSSGNNNPVVKLNDSIYDVLKIMNEKSFGLVNIIDDDMNLKGIITSGDLIRAIEKDNNIFQKKAYEIMNENPITINEDLLAVTAIRKIQSSNNKLIVLPVVNSDYKSVGTLSVNKLIKENIL